jgi:NAD(P)-dependent dehydrogenase (short-subunit alcohol dehydrogenase family)
MTTSIPGAGLLSGKTATITGSAMGLGKVMARVFVREGAKVLAVDFDPSNEESLADIGPDCVPYHADVSKEEEVKAMFDKAVELFGRVDIAVNNAATQAAGGADDLSAASYDEFTQTNFLGVMLCTRYALETMVPAGGGSIINVSSVGSLNTEDRAPVVYAAAKAAVNSLTKAIAVKYGAQDIRANVLAPGFTHTEKTLGAPRDVIVPMEQKSALGRAGEPEEQAHVAAFLASDRASYVNGVVLPVDGGWSVRMA